MAAAAAIGIVLIVFPDVVFLEASVTPSQLIALFDPQPERASLLPEGEGRQLRDGYRDLGGPTFQLESAHEAMRNVLREGESPYWNPYSGAGTLGVERLATPSASVVTLTAALLGAGSRGLHLALLATLVAAIYCLFRALTVYLHRSGWAATAACFAFVLVGFHTSMISAQMVRPYILAPILLHALLAVSARPTAWRFVGAVLASSLLFAETFMPTTELVLICVHVLCFAAATRRWRRPRRDALRQVALQGGVAILGFLLLAPLWFPVIESLPQIDLSAYEDRKIRPARPWGAVSMLTPKHFWESYEGFTRTRGFEDSQLMVTKIETTRVYHLGLVACFIAVQALAGARTRRNPVPWVALALAVIAAGRTFGVRPMVWVAELPLLDMISLQYWGAAVCLPFCLLLAYGFDGLSAKSVWSWPTLMLAVALAWAAVFLFRRLGVPSWQPAAFHLSVAAAILVVIGLSFLVLRLKPEWRRGAILVLLIVMVAEYLFYLNHLRPVRKEIDFDEIGFVGFLRKNLDDGRILNVGARGIPPHWGAALGIPQIGSLDGMNLRGYAEFFDQRFEVTDHFLAIRGNRARLPPERLEAFDSSALDLLGVRYVLVTKVMKNYQQLFEERGMEVVFTAPRLRIFENPDAYPRSFAAGTLIEAPGIPSDRGLDGRKVALTDDPELVRQAAKLGVASLEDAPVAAGNVRISEYRNARIVLEAELESPGVVVLTDVWHPNWRVEVNGEEAHLGRVDQVLRGVAVGAGRHRIEMRYSPRSLPAAMVVSLLVLLALAAAVVRGHTPRGGLARETEVD